MSQHPNDGGYFTNLLTSNQRPYGGASNSPNPSPPLNPNEIYRNQQYAFQQGFANHGQFNPTPQFYNPNIQSTFPSPPSQPIEGQPSQQGFKVPKAREPAKDADDDDDLEEVAEFRSRKLWSKDEEKVLAEAWIEISQDKDMGNDKDNDFFWNEIYELFNERTTGDPRTKNMLTGKWTRLNSDCQKINSNYKHIGRRSGENEYDQIKNAETNFEQRFGTRSFTYLHVWEILKQYPKWDAEDPLNFACLEDIFGPDKRPRPETTTTQAQKKQKSTDASSAASSASNSPNPSPPLNPNEIYRNQQYAFQQGFANHGQFNPTPQFYNPNIQSTFPSPPSQPIEGQPSQQGFKVPKAREPAKGREKKTKAQRGKKVVNLDADDDDDLEEVAEFRSRKLWSKDEEKVLAEAWIEISQDKDMGNDKDNDFFWNEIYELFNERTTGDHRTKNMLTGKWTRLNSDCQKFNSNYKHIGRRSGENEYDQIKNAETNFEQRFGTRSFTYLHVWEILKQYPKWDAEDPLNFACLEDIFGPDKRPRPETTTKQAQKKQKSTDASSAASSGGSQTSSFSGHLSEKYFAAKDVQMSMYEMKKAKEQKALEAQESLSELHEMQLLMLEPNTVSDPSSPSDWFNWDNMYTRIVECELIASSKDNYSYMEVTKASNVSEWASATILSKTFWLWLNPLLEEGHKNPLTINDIPILSPEHQAEKLSLIFEQNWPKPEEKSKHPVRTALLRCFWQEIAFTGILATLNMGVMYVGPLLIQRFVDFTSGKSNSSYEGYYLVLILIVAKFVQVLSQHHFYFHSQNLGMLIRSTLITSLYKKGLRLSCSSRHSHGLGQIVNYMTVDVQQLCDFTPELHTIWVIPLKVAVALAILYMYLGLSTIVTLIAVLLILLLATLGTKRNNGYQINIMTSCDSRMKSMSQMLNFMRVIKFQAWEQHFNDRIQSFRDSEYSWLCKFMYSMGVNMIMLWSMPLFISTVTFGSAILLGVKLDAGTVFTATALLKNLQEPLWNFPQSMISLSQAMISLGRLDEFMNSKELDERSIERHENSDNVTAVTVQNGSFSWHDELEGDTIKNINFEIRKGELTAIVGTVDSGKSSLLASVIGEMHKTSGKVTVTGSTAYVAQTSWIQNSTIQENILFGSPMDQHKYKNVIRTCCLEKDIEMMEFGDQTEIGERGINLSGGQKQRIQLARAVYQDSDIYLLDDVFSAVDAHTGSQIFKECVRGVLRDKTILLVTHQVDFLHNVDLILVMHDGRIVQSGKYDELVQSGLNFKALVHAHETSMQLVHKESTQSESVPNAHIHNSKQDSIESDKSQELFHSNSDAGTSKLIEDEERETGRVSLHVYKVYATEAYGWFGVIIVLLLSILWQATQMASDYWLAYETSEDRADSFDPYVFIGVYAAIGGISFVVVTGRIIFALFIGLVTAQKFFKQILDSILHAPMSFFDITPSGRILSRVKFSFSLGNTSDKMASSDQSNLDFLLPFMMQLSLFMYMSVISVIIITCQYAWPTVFLLVPLGWLNFWYRGYYLATSRELTRLDSITKAPVIHHFSESISGVMTIRCFKKQDSFIQENADRVDGNLRMDFHNNGSSGWLGFRLEFLGSLFLCVSTVFMILLPSNAIKPENVGLSLSYGLSLNSLLYFALFASCFVENRMVSVERIKQFTNIPSEAEWVKKDSPPPPDWPNHGSLELKDLQVRYRSNTPLVLKGITLTIQGGQKIGVVGRTGGGKSTLIQVLFRLVEPSGGSIIIDGIDISTLGLHDLRSRFGIIPQEPVLFEGTVRSNIDPIGQFSDEEIWKSLTRCQLYDVVSAKPGKLDSADMLSVLFSLVVDNGDNWSVGQRQLLCLGRVLLKHSRLLFMDEATASVDSQTDGVIQRIIREDFADSTVVSIAHRIPTVMDCDRVLVIDAGYAKEFDKPSNLIERSSLFGALVQEYANRSSGF
ncbi:ABC transporter Tap-like, P-loop containing nucleoside triphosphate hydrolase [Artemisia annua]|uniref:ABC-type xenobiotic transporter n=1 Tax=Artemisia annua TaxID=35608 RepID=A0A2U1Q917_ARTAN|nr:ABC transporter Tap-like, P-loop containing nucleoside triphosphate hydrolase [Artemisia annua]